uniref:Putative uncharacterized protein YPR123C n=1 Tax=Saccharomyces cerevisiae (strain ATCC 204508 / S288c) TaxID=559292 RepID=YP123_YEAST|nr:RecName: Full=Putative uncharacterized protein YPR123C [Saccharomyces cerevisiae S288C]AAB68067.1 Ypr123cp [Saccharomyces cerevisiae]AAT93295.1 YPR123C [Saccharomyces cerevisiae]
MSISIPEELLLSDDDIPDMPDMLESEVVCALAELVGVLLIDIDIPDIELLPIDILAIDDIVDANVLLALDIASMLIDDMLDNIVLLALDIASMLIDAILDATVLDALDMASIFMLLPIFIPSILNVKYNTLFFIFYSILPTNVI